MRHDRPSATALFIARSLVFWAREPRVPPLLDGRAVGLALACLRAAGVDGRRWWRCCGIPWIRRAIWCAERWLLPGIVLHYVLRKRAVAAEVERALAAGAGRVVVLAGGFDALAWRLRRRHPHLAVTEVDHPATQAVKRRAIAHTHGWPTLCPLDLVAGDLAEVLDRTRPTVVVAEGLLMYFTPEQVSALLSRIGMSVAPRSTVVFTCMTAGPDGRLGFPAGHPLIDRWLARKREVFRWGIRASELPGFLASAGLHLVAHVEAPAFARALPPGFRRRGAVGEDLVVAGAGEP